MVATLCNRRGHREQVHVAEDKRKLQFIQYLNHECQRQACYCPFCYDPDKKENMILEVMEIPEAPPGVPLKCLESTYGLFVVCKECGYERAPIREVTTDETGARVERWYP